MDFTPEHIQQAARVQDPAALQALARTEGVELTDRQARDYFTKLHPPAGELADDELEAVSGGGCGGASGGAPSASGPTIVCPKFRKGDLLYCAVLSMCHGSCESGQWLKVEAVIRDGEKGFRYTMKCPQCGVVTGTVEEEYLSYDENLLVMV